jgi:hypothetical protein
MSVSLDEIKKASPHGFVLKKTTNRSPTLPTFHNPLKTSTAGYFAALYFAFTLLLLLFLYVSSQSRIKKSHIKARERTTVEPKFNGSTSPETEKEIRC